ncbi:MAG TPA: chalcone isomerase family protein [Candidatus Acidoferrum sp.]|nr:chalcone isomerase family protein [Candidatus Acidoferrum sp.]
MAATANLQIARAQSRASLPPAVLQKAPALHQVGRGSHSYFGLRVYQVTLWAASNRWNPDEPHALDLESNRAIPSNQLTDAGMDEMNRLGVGTPQQRQAWRREMERVLPSVNRGDQVVVFCAPNHKTYFFYNGRERGEIDDPVFGAAFFGIWLDPRTNNPALRRSLLNH